MDATSDDKERYLQGFLSVGAFINSGIQHMINEKSDKATEKLYNALTICQKFIKSIRGY